ncbi:Transcription factor WhiB [Actinacidiphila yanglinensis]|uniref:Transcriptional regulator WhiB n=1 Tax=Actinacidiphila yanglinensis TaxID=310779 RepID=A0A1H6BQZ0_9ACTN|nr:Transcription factor WhiB [Actinacidiphila yanglinensis]
MADFSRLPGPNADLWDWQLVAACRGVDSSLFFHPEGERGAARSAREAAAKEVCMRCPVRAECATHALAVREPYGVWGGLTEDEREAMMGRSRHRGTDRDDDDRERERDRQRKRYERYAEADLDDIDAVDAAGDDEDDDAEVRGLHDHRDDYDPYDDEAEVELGVEMEGDRDSEPARLY